MLIDEYLLLRGEITGYVKGNEFLGILAIHLLSTFPALELPFPYFAENAPGAVQTPADGSVRTAGDVPYLFAGQVLKVAQYQHSTVLIGQFVQNSPYVSSEFLGL